METPLTQLIWRQRKIAFVITDRDLVIQELHGLPEIIDVDENGCLGRSLFEIFPELLGSHQELDDILDGSLNSWRVEFVNHETRQGAIRYLTMEGLPYRDKNGGIAGLIHLVQDVTKWGELEQQITQNRNELQLLQEKIERQNRDLIAANMELRRLSELKSQFISVAAHELRSPLTSLNGYVEMLIDGEMGALPEKQLEALQIVQMSGLRLVSLTESLLNAARLEAGQIDLVLQPVDLAGLVQGVVEEHQVRIQSKSQSLRLELSPSLPPALCDEIWAKQIVTNLLSNASKFTSEHGCISVRVQGAEQPGYLELSVEDTGVGIPEPDQARIFSRWFRAKNASINAGGSGLGLYITHALVALHNGSIWFESQPHQGCIFHVTFPIAA